MIGHSLQKCVATESGCKVLKMSMRESSFQDLTVAALNARRFAGDLPQSLCVLDTGIGPRIRYSKQTQLFQHSREMNIDRYLYLFFVVQYIYQHVI